MTEETNCYECDTPLVSVCPQCNPHLSAAPSPAGDEVTDLDRIEFQLKEISAPTVEYGADGIPCGYGPPAHSAEEMADKALTCLALLDRHRAAISAMRPALSEACDPHFRELKGPGQ